VGKARELPQPTAGRAKERGREADRQEQIARDFLSQEGAFPQAYFVYGKGKERTCGGKDP